jgi:hypothetical protein
MGIAAARMPGSWRSVPVIWATPGRATGNHRVGEALFAWLLSLNCWQLSSHSW